MGILSWYVHRETKDYVRRLLRELKKWLMEIDVLAKNVPVDKYPRDWEQDYQEPPGSYRLPREDYLKREHEKMKAEKQKAHDILKGNR